MDKPKNKGAVELTRILSERGAKARFAETMGVGADMVSRWVSGERCPDPKHRAKIEDDLHISWRLWDELADEPEEAPPESGPAGEQKEAG